MQLFEDYPFAQSELSVFHSMKKDENNMQRLEIIYRSQTITIEYFLRSSEEQKEVILYLHGLGCCKSDFLNATKTELFRDYTLLAIDFPGHGGSSYPEK